MVFFSTTCGGLGGITNKGRRKCFILQHTQHILFNDALNTFYLRMHLILMKHSTHFI